MTTEDGFIRKLYGDASAAAPNDPPAGARTGFEQLADRLYDNTPAPAATGRELYAPDAHLRPIFAAHREALEVKFGLTRAEVEHVEQDFTRISREAGLNDTDAATLYDLGVHAELAARARRLAAAGGQDHAAASGAQGDPAASADGAGDHAQATDAEAALEPWREESRTALRAQYGQEDAERLLARVDRFLERKPALNALLTGHGLRERPDVVAMLVRHVFINGIV